MSQTTLTIPPGRQGPGALPAPLVQALDFTTTRRAGGVLPGERRAIGLGSGTELAQLRPYEYGDDVRLLDAAASARTGVPHVRQHVPERALTTWVLLDLSPSMAFGTARRLKSDVAEGVTRVAGRIALRRGGRLALLTCGTPRPRLLEPRGGRGALASLERVLSEGVAPDGAPPDDALAAGCRRVGALARERGLIIVVSDFREPPTSWKRALATLGQRHALLAIEIGDPRERELPAVGRVSLVDPETGTRVEVDTSSGLLRERYAAAEAARRGSVASALRRSGAEQITLCTSEDWLRVLGRKMERGARR